MGYDVCIMVSLSGLEAGNRATDRKDKNVWMIGKSRKIVGSPIEHTL